MLTQPTAGLLGFAALFLAAGAAAALMRWVRCPGSAVVGGVLAGVLMGPTILGRVMPALHERVFVGGVVERQERDRAFHELERERVVAQRAAAENESVARLQREHRATEDAWAAARWRDQRGLRLASLALVAITLLSAGAARCAGQLAAAMSIGGWAAAVPGALTYAVLHYGLDVAIGPAAPAAAATAIGPFVIAAADRRIANDAEVGGAALIEASGSISTLLSLLIASWGLWLVAGGLGLICGAPLLAAGVRLLLPRSWTDAAAGAREHVLVPALAACAAGKVELLLDFELAPVVLLLLVSGDARWLGALIGTRIAGGRPWLRSMRLVMASIACGPTQLAVAAVAAHGDLIDPALTLALIAGALVLEVGAPLRRSLAGKLAEIEVSGRADRA